MGHVLFVLPKTEKEETIMCKREDYIKVLLVRPDRKPVPVVINNELEAMQKLVGGLIEQYFYFEDDPEVVCVFNEEGKITNLPLNRAICDEYGEIVDIIAGDFFVALAPYDSEYYHSLTDELVEKYSCRFDLAERFFIDASGKIRVRNYATSY